MANVPDTRTTRSIGNSPDLALTASDPKRILRSANCSFQAAFASPDMNRDADNQVKPLEHALEYDNKGPPSSLAREPAHSPAQLTPERLASAEFRKTVRLMAQEEVERTYESRVSVFITRAAEEALFNALKIGYKSENAGLKNTSYHLVKSVLTEMAHKRALDEVVNRNIKRWTKSSTFIDPFAKRALTTPRFVRPAAKFIRKIMCDQDDKRKGSDNGGFPSPSPRVTVSFFPFIKILV